MNYYEYCALLGALIAIPNIIFLVLFRPDVGPALKWIAFDQRLKSAALIVAGARTAYLSWHVRQMPVLASPSDQIWGIAMLGLVAFAAVTHLTVYLAYRRTKPS